MRFDQKYYPGTEFDWLCLDIKGHIGFFSAVGYGPVPESILDIRPLFSKLLDRLKMLPVVGEAVVSPQVEQEVLKEKKLRREKMLSVGVQEADMAKVLPHIAPFRDAATRGLFAFDWVNEAGREYKLAAAPEKPLIIDAISDQQWEDLATKTVLSLATKTVLPVDFETVKSIPPDIDEI